MKVTYSFEDIRRHYTKYKSTTGELTVFVDYGEGNSDTAFDHHAFSDNSCSTSLICSEEGVARLKSILADTPEKSLRIVTHSSPDFDSIAAAAVVTRFAKGNHRPLSKNLVEYIRAKDQGENLHEDIKQSVWLLFQAMKNNRDNDHDMMISGITLLDTIDNAIQSGIFHLGWSDLADVSSLHDLFGTEMSLFETAIEKCQTILAKAPKTLLSLPCDKNGVQNFQWAEALFIDFSNQKQAPLGWKELIRSERRLTMSGKAFPCMGVYSLKCERENFIFSVTPESHFSLKALGAYLDTREEQRSNELQAQGNFSSKLKEIARKRGKEETPSLIRSKADPRHGYSNSDPWYDGRGHNYTIVDTPESGSVLDPAEILIAFLQRYNPIWKEQIRKDQAKCVKFDLRNTSQSIVVDWMLQLVPQWDGKTELRKLTKEDGYYCLADVISSLENLNTKNCKYAVYVPIIPSSAQTLPEENSDIHVFLAHYLIAHRNNPICTSLPRHITLKAWAKKLVCSPLPGKWWSVSDSIGMVMFDYMPDEKSGSLFKKVTEQYFDLAKQLKWTDTLTSGIRQKKRYDALVEFVERSKLL